MKFDATEFLGKCHRPNYHAGCIQTSSGKLFDVLEPQSEDVSIADIAQGLAYKYRYTGQIGPITVAEHSVVTSRVIACLGGTVLQQWRGLMHDACEAYTHDIPAPVRQATLVKLRNGYTITWEDLDDRVNLAVSKKLGDGYPFTLEDLIKSADVIAFLIEKRQIPLIRDQEWGLPEIPDAAAHLSVQFLPPVDSKQLFLARYFELRDKLAF